MLLNRHFTPNSRFGLQKESLKKFISFISFKKLYTNANESGTHWVRTSASVVFLERSPRHAALGTATRRIGNLFPLMTPESHLNTKKANEKHSCYIILLLMSIYTVPTRM